MSIIVDFFRTVLFIPLFNALVLLYEYLGDFGLAVIVLTLLIRLVLYPLSAKATKAQKRLSELQPKVQEIQAKFKGNRTKLAEATMELYKKEKINPFATFLPLLLQLPVMIALYQLFWRGFNGDKLNLLYSFIAQPEAINTTFLNLVDLAKTSLPLAVLAGLTQFIQVKQTMAQKKQNPKAPSGDFSSIMQKQMLFIFPVIIVVIGMRMPSAVALYLVVSNIFSIAQYWWMSRNDKKEKALANANA